MNKLIKLDELIFSPKVDHTPAEFDEASRLLLKAAHLIETQGHIHACGVEGGPHCILSAIFYANGARFHREAEHRFGRAIGNEYGVPQWSDTHDKDEVVSKLRAVALGG